MIDSLINVENFASLSGVSGTNKSALIKMHGLKLKKTYKDWYNFVSKDFTIPKDLRKIKEEEISFKSFGKSKEILKQIKDKKN